MSGLSRLQGQAVRPARPGVPSDAGRCGLPGDTVLTRGLSLSTEHLGPGGRSRSLVRRSERLCGRRPLSPRAGLGPHLQTPRLGHASPCPQRVHHHPGAQLPVSQGPWPWLLQRHPKSVPSGQTLMAFPQVDSRSWASGQAGGQVSASPAHEHLLPPHRRHTSRALPPSGRPQHTRVC